MRQTTDFDMNDEMVVQSYRDIVKRSMTGSYIYLLIWFSIIIPSQFFLKSPYLCLWFTVTLVVLAAARICLIINFEQIYHKKPLLWKLLFYPVVWMAPLSWGMMCAAAIFLPDLHELMLVSIITTAGLAGGGVSTLVPNRILTIGQITAFLLPGELALLLSDGYDASVSIVFFLYWAGLNVIAKNQYHEYWRALKHSFLIKKYAGELERLNTLDGLTGLKNRTAFDTFLRQDMKTAIRAKSHLSLLFMDIDHFKKINDKYGHLVGDECLRQLSALFMDQIKRETDTVARYGGEEFAAILPDCTRDQAVSMAEQVRKAVESLEIHSGDISVSLTVSIGVASICPEPGTAEESLIELADSALYKAKHNGRNQVW